MTTIACASDLHGNFDLNWPEADILIFAGDILPDFYRDEYNSAKAQTAFLPQFNDFLKKLPYKHIVVGFGNHDWCTFLDKSARHLITNGHYLENESIELEGLKIFVSPFQSWFFQWAFNLPENDAEHDYPAARKMWNAIPDDTNVIAIHGPPRGIHDFTSRNQYVGCPILRDRIPQLKQLKLGIYGHIHTGYGQSVINGVTHVGASVCNEKYQPVNPIQVITV